MTEDRIERIVEREMNRLDRAFMNGKYSREQYEREVRILDEWASRQYEDIYNETQGFRVAG